MIDEAGQLEGVEDERAVSGVEVQAAPEVELDLAGQRVGVSAGVELGELVAVDVELELKVAGGELHLCVGGAGEHTGREIGSEKRRSRYLTMSGKPLPAPRQRPPAPAPIERDLERAGAYAASALAPATYRAYERDWRTFADWCGAHALPALPADPASLVLLVGEPEMSV